MVGRLRAGQSPKRSRNRPFRQFEAALGVAELLPAELLPPELLPPELPPPELPPFELLPLEVLPLELAAGVDAGVLGFDGDESEPVLPESLAAAESFFTGFSDSLLLARESLR